MVANYFQVIYMYKDTEKISSVNFFAFWRLGPQPSTLFLPSLCWDYNGGDILKCWQFHIICEDVRAKSVLHFQQSIRIVQWGQISWEICWTEKPSNNRRLTFILTLIPKVYIDTNSKTNIVNIFPHAGSPTYENASKGSFIEWDSPSFTSHLCPPALVPIFKYNHLSLMIKLREFRK